MFDYFISLGWYCGTASSLSKHGFRSSSDPFDWYFSDLDSVMHFIETDFYDFLLRENLEEVRESPMVFEDKKYNLRFYHEIKNNLYEDYADIYEKYLRRIERFRAKIKSPSCFVRAVRDENELQYIVDNQDYIKRTIRGGNCLNEIVFLIPQWIQIQKELSFPHFVLYIEKYSEAREDLRGMFDNNQNIIDFLQRNIAVPNIVSNLKWDMKSELQYYEVIKHKYNIAIELLNNDLNASLIPDHIAIYGAGNIGKAFFNKCKEMCTVECFIDALPAESEYKGIPILSLNRINEIACNNIIITPCHDIDNIKNWFETRYQKADLIMLDMLFLKGRSKQCI